MFLISSGALMDLLRAQELLSPEQLEQLPSLVDGRSSDGRALAKILVHRGFISRYQAQMLVSGKAEQLKVGKYRIMDMLGEGGLSRVFLARHVENNWTVALKIIRPEALTRADGRQQFLQEMEAMARLDHPNIVQFLDVDQSGENFYYAMEYVLGTDVRRLVQYTGPLPVYLAADFARQVAFGLQHAHERSLVHRDIKPANLYLTNPKGPSGEPTEENLIKILDWGLASVRAPGQGDGDDKKSQHLIGTVDYLSPEQALNPQAASIRSDIYSLGCTVYYLLTGQVPFPDGNIGEKLRMHQSQEPAPISQFRADVPAAFLAVLKRMLCKRPEDRYRTPDALALALASHARRPSGVPGINHEALARAARVRGFADSNTTWSLSQSLSGASRHTLFTEPDTAPQESVLRSGIRSSTRVN